MWRGASTWPLQLFLLEGTLLKRAAMTTVTTRMKGRTTPMMMRTPLMMAMRTTMTLSRPRSTCPGCEEDSCVFIRHKDSLVAHDEAEHGSLALEDAPDNNIRRKKLHRQCTLMINGGPLGAGVRRPLPSCCTSAIREMLPSETFMVFLAE
jgi:hypothetical protein